jgi:hypothetical protein
MPHFCNEEVSARGVSEPDKTEQFKAHPVGALLIEVVTTSSSPKDGPLEVRAAPESPTQLGEQMSSCGSPFPFALAAHIARALML